jgi:hypothetical protein
MTSLVITLATWAHAQESYSVLTYNAQFRPGIVGLFDGGSPGSNYDIYGMHDKDRALRIAEHLVEVAPDIIVLQEMFEPDAVKALQDALVTRYPNQTRYHEGGPLELVGSGLASSPPQTWSCSRWARSLPASASTMSTTRSASSSSGSSRRSRSIRARACS